MLAAITGTLSCTTFRKSLPYLVKSRQLSNKPTGNQCDAIFSAVRKALKNYDPKNDTSTSSLFPTVTSHCPCYKQLKDDIGKNLRVIEDYSIGGGEVFNTITLSNLRTATFSYTLTNATTFCIPRKD